MAMATVTTAAAAVMVVLRRHRPHPSQPLEHTSPQSGQEYQRGELHCCAGAPHQQAHELACCVLQRVLLMQRAPVSVLLVVPPELCSTDGGDLHTGR